MVISLAKLICTTKDDKGNLGKEPQLASEFNKLGFTV